MVTKSKLTKTKALTFSSNKKKEPTISEKVIDTYKQAEQQAKQANETRYNDILSQYQKQYDDLSKAYANRQSEALNMLQGYGTQEKADVAQNWGNVQAQQQQDAVDRGMANTTVGMNIPLGTERGKNADLARINERIQQQKLGIYTGLSGDTLNAQQNLMGNKLGFMERREDEYPDLNQMLNLTTGLGETSGAGSSGYSSTSGTSGTYSPFKQIKVGQAGYTPFGGDAYAKRNEPRRTEFKKSFAERLKPKQNKTTPKSANTPTWFDSSKYRT
jgi:hypothetical protein